MLTNDLKCKYFLTYALGAECSQFWGKYYLTMTTQKYRFAQLKDDQWSCAHLNSDHVLI